MDVKQICLIVLFTLFLILSTSSIYAYDFNNSTELTTQVQDDDYISDEGNTSESFIFDEGYYNVFGQWIFDENGNIVFVSSTKNNTIENFTTFDSKENVTDLRNNNSGGNNFPDNIDQIQSESSMSGPLSRNGLWNEFVNNPWGYIEKYNSLPDALSINFDNNVNGNSSCNKLYSKEFQNFMNAINQNRIKHEVIESKDINGPCFEINDFMENSAVKENNNGKNKVFSNPLFKTKDITIKYKKSSKFIIKLLKQDGKLISKQTIKISFKGKNYKVKTDSKGIATFNIPKNLKIGKYNIKTVYNGYVANNRITVKK